MAVPPEILALDVNHACAKYRNLVIIFWGISTLRAAVEGCSAAIVRAGAAHPERLILITILEEDSHIPEPDARTALAAMLRAGGPYIARSAVIQEGSGFRAAAIRGVITSISVVARQPFPHHVFSTIENAVGWLASGPPAGKPSEIISAISSVRASFDIHRGRPRARL